MATGGQCVMTHGIMWMLQSYVVNLVSKLDVSEAATCCQGSYKEVHLPTRYSKVSLASRCCKFPIMGR